MDIYVIKPDDGMVYRKSFYEEVGCTPNEAKLLQDLSDGELSLYLEMPIATLRTLSENLSATVETYEGQDSDFDYHAGIFIHDNGIISNKARAVCNIHVPECEEHMPRKKKVV